MIKRGYRFWDVKRNCYAPNDDFWITHKGEWATHKCSKYLDYKGEDIVAEQSTGLRDKNGKEIYEGDVVSIEHVLVYERTVSHPKRNAIMTWDEGETGFRLSSDSVKNTNPDIYPVCCLEVIGNIHESPELLKGANT